MAPPAGEPRIIVDVGTSVGGGAPGKWAALVGRPRQAATAATAATQKAAEGPVAAVTAVAAVAPQHPNPAPNTRTLAAAYDGAAAKSEGSVKIEKVENWTPADTPPLIVLALNAQAGGGVGGGG